MEITEILGGLKQELLDKKGLFAKKIDLNKCQDLVLTLEEALPEKLKEAEFILLNKQKILENADNVAKNTIREAEERAEHIIGNTEIVRKAEIEATKIVETAYMQCDTLVDGTKKHLDVMFKEVEEFLLSNLAMIRNNREELRGAMIIKHNNQQINNEE